MTTFTPVPTANTEWGFWGTSKQSGNDAELTWDTACRFLAKHFDLTAEEARDGAGLGGALDDHQGGGHVA